MMSMRACIVALVIGTTLVFAAGCGRGSSAGAGSSAQAAHEPALRVVALGDSETTGSGDPTGVGWVGRYAKLVRVRRGRDVQVTNLARDGKTSGELLSDIRGDLKTRAALDKADVVLLGIGGADLNAGDDAFAAGKCRGTACYRPVLAAFARNFDETVGGIRSSGDAVILAVAPPNVLTGAEDVIPPFLRRHATKIGAFQARTATRAICKVMATHDGSCVDLLTAFNGASGTSDAYAKGLLNHRDCCYPNAAGQQRIAELLLKTPLPPAG
jgi:lysophospholipase L1-like esterase